MIKLPCNLKMYSNVLLGFLTSNVFVEGKRWVRISSSDLKCYFLSLY